MGKVDKARAHLARIEAQLAAEEARLRGLVTVAATVRSELAESALRTIAAADEELLRHEAAGSPPHQLGWGHPSWQSEHALSADESARLRTRLRLGTHRDDETGAPLRVADTVPFVGSGRSLLITSRGPEEALRAEQLLQSLVARLALMFPQGASFVLLEPARSGGPLVRMGKALPQVQTATSRDQVRLALDAVTARIERIGTEHLSSVKPTFEHLGEREQLDLGIQFVVASDVPSRLGEREIETLDVVASDGPEKGTYAIVHWNLDHDMPVTVRKAPFGHATRVDVGSRRGLLAGQVATTVVFDEIDDDTAARLSRIERVTDADRKIDWGPFAGNGPRWSESSIDRLTTPLAAGGTGDDVISVTFGVDAEGEPVAHGVLAGQTGKGKSRLLHALICGLAVRYSPDEMSLYLIDGKSGLEFERYQTLPHAKVVSLHTPPDLARSVLAELEVEMGRRTVRFTEAGTSDLRSYRATPGAVATPRILCVVDEFQGLFEGGEDEGMRLLSVLTEKGRAYGIHVLIAAQSFQPPGLRNAGRFYGNVALRLALPLDRAELEAVDLFGGSAGRQLVLDTCTSTGRVVINDRGGSARNRPGRVALITDAEVDAVVAELVTRDAVVSDDGDGPRRPVVFHGSHAPRLVDHPLMTLAANAPSWPSPTQLTTMARLPCSTPGGLGHPRWQAGEGPVLVGLGRGLDVHTQTSAMLRRGAAENVVIVGASEPERLGMLLGAAGLMALVHSPAHLHLAVLDRTFAGSEHAHLLVDSIADLVGGRHPLDAVGPSAGATPVPVDDGPAAHARLIESLAAEVERRLALPEADLAGEASVALLAHDLDRVDALRRIDDAYGSSESPLGARLALVLDRGPAVGVHTILSSSYVKAVKDVVGDAGLNRWFRHRVALQMSDDESFDLLRSSAAAKLPATGGEAGLREAVTAIYLDRQTNATVRFKPYTTFAPSKEVGSVVDDLEAVAEVQRRWGTA